MLMAIHVNTILGCYCTCFVVGLQPSFAVVVEDEEFAAAVHVEVFAVVTAGDVVVAVVEVFGVVAAVDLEEKDRSRTVDSGQP